MTTLYERPARVASIDNICNVYIYYCLPTLEQRSVENTIPNHHSRHRAQVAQKPHLPPQTKNEIPPPSPVPPFHTAIQT